MFDYLKIIVFVLASNLYLTSINAQLVINELSPDNASNFTDECGENPDWVNHPQKWGCAGTVALKSKTIGKHEDRGKACVMCVCWTC